MSLGGLVLGIINIAIVVVILVLVGALVVWFLSLMQWPVPWNVQRLYLAVVALVALYMLVALLLGIPTIHLVGGRMGEMDNRVFVSDGTKFNEPPIAFNGLWARAVLQ